ncbi:hypothetical protein [Modestobacter sp. SYSU DS0290]
MSRTTLPGHRSRWRAAAAGLAIATVSFTTAACGGEEGEGGGTGVVEDGGGDQEEDGGGDQEEDGGGDGGGDQEEDGEDD